MRPVLLLHTSLLFLPAAGLHASTLIWMDDFSRSANPLTYDHTTNASNDYTVAGTSGIVPTLASNTLAIADGAGTQFAQNVLADQFAPFTLAPGDTVVVTLDVNISSFIATNAASTFRLSILNGNPVNGTGALTVGWGYGNLDTNDAGSELFFYSSNSAGGTPTITQAIGWTNGGTNAASAAPGFDFGDYNSGAAASNDTAPVGSATPSAYRIAMNFIQGSTAAGGTVTNLTTSQSASFSNTLGGAFDWTNSNTDGLQILTGLGGTGTFNVDNITVSHVPEPSAPLLASLALLGLTRRRR